MSSNKKAVAKKALRHLHVSLVNNLDPNAKDEFFGNDLISLAEKQKIEAAGTPHDKNNALLDALRRRDNEDKVMDVLIQYLEGDDKDNKTLNEKLLRKVEEAYKPYYFYDELEHDSPQKETQQPRSGPIVIQIPPTQPPPVKVPLIQLPKKGSLSQDNGLPLRKIALPSTTEEGTDGGGRIRGGAYPMNTIPKGLCVIINNENFVNMKARAGSSWDADSLKKLFDEHLGFQVEAFRDLSSKAILDLMDQIRQLDHSKLKCLIICILTHGVDGQIYGADGQLVSVQKLTRTFTGTQCPTLAGKPKVFLLQACRGGDFDHGVTYEETDDGNTRTIINEGAVLAEDETDGGGYKVALPDEADFLLAYATTPGFVSWRNSAFGTWFIKAFVDTMYAQADQDHLMDILTEVNRKVAEEYHSREFKKQMPAPVTMLRYKLYLPPVRQ